MLAFLSLVALLGWRVSLIARRPPDPDPKKGPPDEAAKLVVATWRAESDACSAWTWRARWAFVILGLVLWFLLALRADICDAGSEAPRLEVLAWVVGIL